MRESSHSSLKITALTPILSPGRKDLLPLSAEVQKSSTIAFYILPCLTNFLSPSLHRLRPQFQSLPRVLNSILCPCDTVMSPRKNTNLAAPLVHHIAPSAYHQHRICIWLSRFVNSSPSYISSIFPTQVKKPFIAYTLSCFCPPTHLTSHCRLLGRPSYSEAGQQRLGQSTVTSERSHYNQRKARMCRSGLEFLLLCTSATEDDQDEQKKKKELGISTGRNCLRVLPSTLKFCRTDEERTLKVERENRTG